jgi:hypothetical protein
MKDGMQSRHAHRGPLIGTVSTTRKLFCGEIASWFKFIFVPMPNDIMIAEQNGGSPKIKNRLPGSELLSRSPRFLLLAQIEKSPANAAL